MDISILNTSCSICMNEFENPCCIGCSHLFCRNCIETWTTPNSYNALKCPVCRKKILGLFPLPINFLRARYKTRSNTGHWRGIQLYFTIVDSLTDLNASWSAEQRKEHVHKLFSDIYENKWVFEKKYWPETGKQFLVFCKTLKEKINCMSKDGWVEAKIWKYKFKNILT